MNLFDTSGFPPRWSCGWAWAEQPWVGWMHILSDLVIFAAYFAVPIVVMYFVRQRNDLKFPPIFYGFLGLIFFSCGTVHLVEAGIFWWPVYKLSAVAKLVTAVFSASGVVLLARVLPLALELKSGAAYAALVDDRRKTEAMLKREQFLLGTMMKTVPDLIYFKDTHSRFTHVSDSFARFMGVDTPESVVGRTDYDYFPKDFADETRAEEVELMRTREPMIGKEEPERSAAGEQIWLSSTKLPLLDESGEVIGLFGLSRDITPQKHAAEVMEIAKEAAESASRAKSDFLANMSHEIRTPMNAIMGMTELVLDTDLTPSQHDFLSIVYESAETLLSVINEILDFSKIEAGKLELTAEDISLRDEVGNTLKSLGLRAHTKGIELAWQVHADVPEHFLADPVRLRQVLVNLVGNAIKFTSEGEVVVEVTLEKMQSDVARLHFIVSDTGIGIAEHKLDSVFDAFEQADQSTTRQFGGTGLGLAISKKIIQAMNGRIWVESTLGKGSEFHFIVELPLGEVPPDGTSLADLDLSRIPVVIVDDNATNLRILTEVLQSWNMTVQAVANAPAALEAIHETLASEGELPLLISDSQMPGMDGFTLAEKIRASDELRETVIIILTSGAHSSDAIRCRQLGINAHMMKPAKQSELQQAITRVLGRRPLPSRPAAEKAGLDRPAGRSLQILVVEDGYANQKLAMALLEKWGHQTTLAENGQQAVDAWRTGSFDVILMDVQMPVMDGLTATRTIRDLERASQTGKHVPIVAMTARAMKGDREKCLEVGMDDYVTKPIQREELLNVLESLVSSGILSEHDDAEPTSDTATGQGIASGQGTASGGLIDWNVARKNVQGDEEILKVIVEAALDEFAKLMAELTAAMEAGDAPTALRCAHTLKSTANTFGATLLQECSLAMETDARSGDLDGVRERQPEAERLCQQILMELKDRLASMDSN
ncbi:PAS domain-containing hybrid sensor histidine kinase/response regulator [Aporhodopirellula aestuarii]|uniref:histidine kinase n=1 Tax=Aporhodopirellula aestuarii TaxID=2950107 RepID=A0ABT0TYC3_9BACT|nr:response regulator [Aporhodopirellula aestuarii]MCM2369592.1 response regulator [Aporhodopirellula aestuarii]